MTTRAAVEAEIDHPNEESRRSGDWRTVPDRAAMLPREPDRAPMALYREQAPEPLPMAPVPRESDDTRIVSRALASAQREFPVVRKTRTADAGTKGTYTYANLADVCRETLPILAAQGVFPSWRIAGDRVFLRLAHAESGQYLESDLAIVAPDARKGIQALGSALSYVRRYLYTMMVGIVAVDDDDDGVASMLPETLINFVLEEPDREKVKAEMARKREPQSVREAALRIWDQVHGQAA